jgi:MbtH protein
MDDDQSGDASIYQVVINQEEQYSIWPADREPPFGWSAVGKTGTKQECVAYIREIWTDMRPRSLREEMDGPDTGGEG